jgi:hypothetical protein
MEMDPFAYSTILFFSPTGSDYVLPDVSYEGGMNKEIIRGDSAYAKKFDSGNVTRLEYTNLKTDRTAYVTDGTIGLFGAWLL